MQENTGQITGGINRYDPRSNMRAWAGYVRRSSTYQSSSNLVDQVLRPKQSISVSQKYDVKKNTSFGNTQPAQKNQMINYTGSFEMLPTKPKSIPSSTPATDTFKLKPQLVNELSSAMPDIAVTTRQKLKFHLPKFSTPKVMVGMAMTLFVGGAVISLTSLRTNQEVKAQVKSAVVVSQTNQDSDGGMPAGIPDENINPPAVSSYKVSATFPRIIRITKTNTEARILALGIDSNGSLKAPANIFDAGWYRDSSKPGEAGAMVLDGHVSGPTKPGIFKKLGTLANGDTIEIERGDGQKFVYTVTATELVDADKVDMTKVMVSSVSGKPGLSIITCGGKFDRATNKFEQRTIVYAVIN